MRMRDISELSDNEKLDLEYYNNQVKTKKFMSKKAIKIWGHFQKNPFSMDIKIGDLGTKLNKEPFKKLDVYVEIKNWKELVIERNHKIG